MSSSTGRCCDAKMSSASKFWRVMSIMAGGDVEAWLLQFKALDQALEPALPTPAPTSPAPLIGVVMGSSSDWETMKQAADILTEFGIAFEARVVSAHRMPDEMFA
jgi:hypothetical protein